MRLPRFSTLQLLLAAAFCGLVLGLVTTCWRSASHRRISAIAFSPSGQTLAARYDGGGFQAWSVGTGAARLPAQTSMGRATDQDWGPVRFANDDTLIDIRQDFRAGSPKEVNAIDLRTSRVKVVLSLPRNQRYLAFAAGNDLLAVATWPGGTIECYELGSRKLVRQVQGAVSSPYGLDLTPDGKRLVFFDQDSTVQVADVATGQRVGITASPNTIVAELTRDGRFLATADNIGSPVEVHKLTTGEPPRRIEHSVGEAQWLAFTADGERLAVAGYDAVELYDVATNKRMGRIALGELQRSSVLSPVRAYSLAWQQLALAPDGTTLATIDGDQITLWDLKSGKVRSTLGGGLRTVQVVMFTLGFALWSAVWGIATHRSRRIDQVAGPIPLELKLCWGLMGIGGLVAIAAPVAILILGGSLAWPTMYYSLLMGIFAVSRGAGRDPTKPWQVAALQMINVIACDPVNFLLGILSLALLRRPHVRQFLSSVNPAPVSP